VKWRYQRRVSGAASSPEVRLDYLWPFDLDRVASFLSRSLILANRGTVLSSDLNPETGHRVRCPWLLSWLCEFHPIAVHPCSRASALSNLHAHGIHGRAETNGSSLAAEPARGSKLLGGQRSTGVRDWTGLCHLPFTVAFAVRPCAIRERLDGTRATFGRVARFSRVWSPGPALDRGPTPDPGFVRTSCRCCGGCSGCGKTTYTIMKRGSRCGVIHIKEAIC
jgi:hypothetical protein